MLVLENGIDFEIDKDDGNIKKVEKRTRTTKYCPSPISAINHFGVYTAPKILGEQIHLTPSKFIAPINK